MFKWNFLCFSLCWSASCHDTRNHWEERVWLLLCHCPPYLETTQVFSSENNNQNKCKETVCEIASGISSFKCINWNGGAPSRRESWILKEAGREEGFWEWAITVVADILVLFFSIAPLEDTKYYSNMADFNLNLGTGGSCGHRQLS